MRLDRVGAQGLDHVQGMAPPQRIDDGDAEHGGYAERRPERMHPGIGESDVSESHP